VRDREPHHPLAVRTTITLACFVFGLVLVGLSFVEPPVSDPSRPNLLYVGIGVLVLGLLLAVAGRRRDETAVSRDVQPTGDVAVLEPAPPVTPPRAEVALRVGGNAASEPSVRWYQVAAVTGTDIAARKAHVSVTVRGEQAAAEHWH